MTYLMLYIGHAKSKNSKFRKKIVTLNQCQKAKGKEAKIDVEVKAIEMESAS